MLSLDFPELMSALESAGPGLFPFELSDGSMVLAIKSGSDFALAAKVIAEIRFHLYDIELGGQAALGVITAIFDRQNAPSTIRTICSDPFNRLLVATVSQSDLRIGFFDMHNSEVFCGHWTLNRQTPTPTFVNRAVPLSFGPTLPLEFHVETMRRFSNLDDGYSIIATLTKIDAPTNFSVLQLTDELQNSRQKGQHGIFHSTLEADGEIVGELLETQLARQLASIYGRERTYIGPSTNRRPEFCDVIALGEREVICIQAKASVRSEDRILEDESRRKSRSTKHYKKALDQAIGSERAFYRSGEDIQFKGISLGLKPNEKLLIHIIVVPEKSPSLFDDWTKMISDKNKFEAIIIVFDQGEFDSFCTVYRSSDDFLRAIFSVHEAFQASGEIKDYMFGKDRLVAL